MERKKRKGLKERRRGGGRRRGPEMRPVSALEDRSEEKRRSAQQARAHLLERIDKRLMGKKRG